MELRDISNFLLSFFVCFFIEEETKPRVTHLVSDRSRTNRTQVTSLGVFLLWHKVKSCHSWKVWGHPACFSLGC